MSVQKNAIEQKKVLTETRPIDLRMTKAELDTVRLIAHVTGYRVENVINSIFHRSVYAELETTFDGVDEMPGHVQKLKANLSAEFDRAFDEINKEI